MELRIDHGPPWLGPWLQDRRHHGLGVPEAECLCLRMYYRFGGVPMALRYQRSRVTLAGTLAELARRVWVRTANGAAGDDLLIPPYWQQLLTPSYHRSGPIYDYALAEGVFHRLQRGLG